VNITRLLCPAAALALAACAAAPTTPPLQASLTNRAPAPEAAAAPFDMAVADVIDITPKPAADPGLTCRETKITGSHIRRTVCEQPLTAAEAEMQEEFFRSDLDYARELALREEYERAQQLLFERMPLHQMNQMMRR